MSSSSKSSVPPRGGVSIEPTPANNMKGGSGYGDSGIPKGGGSGQSPSQNQGEQHESIMSNIATVDLSSLERQKGANKERYQAQLAEHAEKETGASAQREDPAGLSTNRNFMYEKPGHGQETLSGSTKVKDVVKDLAGRH